MNAELKKFAMTGPGGSCMETTASDARRAWNNFRARLHYVHGLSWYDAGRYDHSDIREVRP